MFSFRSFRQSRQRQRIRFRPAIVNPVAFHPVAFPIAYRSCKTSIKRGRVLPFVEEQLSRATFGKIVWRLFVEHEDRDDSCELNERRSCLLVSRLNKNSQLIC